MSSDSPPDLVAALGHPVDFGRRSRDYAVDRPGFPDGFYERIEQMKSIRGARALDLGTGPGQVALELAARGAASVVGLDISANQIAAARELADQRGLAAACRFEVAPAEQTGLPDASCDLVTAGTCWHWFDHARRSPRWRACSFPAGCS
jgi:SAM-dependent methyltransferase